MSNDFGRVIEERVGELGWSAAELVERSGVSADVLAEMIGPGDLRHMPEEEVLSQLSRALGLPYRELVISAAAACGLPTSMEGERVYVLRFATNEELVAELRRRLVRGLNEGDARQRKLAHWALMHQALVNEVAG
jgi:hypothetical protein